MVDDPRKGAEAGQVGRGGWHKRGSNDHCLIPLTLLLAMQIKHARNRCIGPDFISTPMSEWHIIGCRWLSHGIGQLELHWKPFQKGPQQQSSYEYKHPPPPTVPWLGELPMSLNPSECLSYEDTTILVQGRCGPFLSSKLRSQ